jgi:hypothetical protein
MRPAPARLSHKGELVAAQLSDIAGEPAERATLTFWIPERIDALLADYERRCSTSRSDVLRGILHRYLYGLCGTPESTPARAMPAARPVRGQWGGRMPQLGKNIVEAKLWLPRRWRDDLAALAAEAGITLSHFAREVVVTQLLGHAYLPARVAEASPSDGEDE